MKNALLIIIFLLPIICLGQKKDDYRIMPSSDFIKSHDSLLNAVFPIKESKVYYELVVKADSINQNELFKRAKIWQPKMFNSPKDAQAFEDREIGFISIKTNFSSPYKDPLSESVNDKIINLSFLFSLKIYTKDNKAKIVIDDLMMFGNKMELYPIETHFSTQTQVVDSMIQQLPKRLRSRFNNYEERKKELISWKETYDYSDAEFISILESFKKAMTLKSESDF